MKFRYSKKRLRMHFIMGTLWSIYGIFRLFFNDEKNWSTYSYLPIGIFFFCIYLFDIKKGVLTYKSPFITKQSIPKKHFDLSQLESVKNDTKGIILLSKTQKRMVIEPSIIKTNDLEKLKQLLAKYEAKT